MIKPVISYLGDEVAPRFRRVVWQPQVAIALGIGVLCFMCGRRWASSEIKLTDIAGLILTYAAIAFGFCITGMALVLTLPNDRFLKSLESHHLQKNGPSSYSDLLFVFSWTAVCHWMLVVLCLAGIAIRGGSRAIIDQYDGRGWRLFISLFMVIGFYSLVQFLLTVITMSQVGRGYCRTLSEPRQESTDRPI
jgi:hypothetical protein